MKTHLKFFQLKSLLVLLLLLNYLSILKMSKARDIMTPDPIVLLHNKKLKDVLRLFSDEKIVSLPVLDDRGRVLGLLTEQALIKAFVISKSMSQPNADISEFKHVFANVAFAQPEDSLLMLVRKLLASDAYRLLVQDKAEKIIGIISPRDIIRALLVKEL